MPQRCGHRREPKKYGPRMANRMVRRSIGVRAPRGPSSSIVIPLPVIGKMNKQRSDNGNLFPQIDVEKHNKITLTFRIAFI